MTVARGENRPSLSAENFPPHQPGYSTRRNQFKKKFGGAKRGARQPGSRISMAQNGKKVSNNGKGREKGFRVEATIQRLKRRRVPGRKPVRAGWGGDRGFLLRAQLFLEKLNPGSQGRACITGDFAGGLAASSHQRDLGLCFHCVWFGRRGAGKGRQHRRSAPTVEGTPFLATGMGLQ